MAIPGSGETHACAVGNRRGYAYLEEVRISILSELAHEQDKIRRARLEEIRVLFLDMSSGERSKIAVSIAAESDAVRKSVSKVLFGFGDTRVEVFKARLNSFMEFLPPARVRFTC